MEVRPRSVRETKADLDSCFGRPTHQLQQAMQARCKAIAKVRNWDQFFAGVGLPAPSAKFLSQWLRTAVLNSGRRRYHDQTGMEQYLGESKRARSVLKSQRQKANQAAAAAWQEDAEFCKHEDAAARFDSMQLESRPSRW